MLICHILFSRRFSWFPLHIAYFFVQYDNFTTSTVFQMRACTHCPLKNILFLFHEIKTEHFYSCKGSLICNSFKNSLTPLRSLWWFTVEYVWLSCTPIDLQTAPLPQWWEATDVRATTHSLRIVLGNGTLSSIHSPPDSQRSSSQREWV